MVRTYKKVLGSRNYQNYTPETLEKALTFIKNKGCSARQASEKFNIPKSTLCYAAKRVTVVKPGGQTVLSEKEEDYLVNGIRCSAEWGFPLTTYDVRLLVKGYLDRCGRNEKRFANNLPGPEWARSFLDRHCASLTTRLSENIKRARASVSAAMVNDYFDHLTESIDGVPPSNIINLDETNFTDDPGKVKVIVKRGCRHPERIIDTSKTSISVMMAGSADGKTLPPYTCYKAEHMWESWTRNGIKGARYNRSKSGWFDQTVFEDWFFSLLVPYAQKLEGKKVVIADNLSSHLSLNVIKACQENNISFVLLPPNSTHLMQPLDVAFFRPMKNCWRGVLTEWKKRNRGCLPKEMFPSLLKQTMDKIEAAQEVNLKAGFAASGIVPLDRDRVLSKLPDRLTNEARAEPWTAAFVEILQETRLNTSAKKVVRRKKITVTPGKSVSGADFGLDDAQDEEAEDDPQPLDEMSLIVEDDIRSDSESSDTEGESSSQAESDSDVSTGVDQGSFKEGDFILAIFKSLKGKSLKFVGRVIEVQCTSGGNAQLIKADFLRPTTSKHDTFVFTDQGDVSKIKISQVIKKLGRPKELRRGRFLFSSAVY
jgi:hypothetical protein